MKIERIKINYYKSIKEPMELDFDNVAIFIGQNNSGKSNILDAIELALDDKLKDDPIFYAEADVELRLRFTGDEVARHQLPEEEGVFILKKQTRKIVFKDKELSYNKALNLVFASSIKRLNEKAFLDLDQIEMDFQSLFNHPQNLDRFKAHLKHHFPKISATKNALDIHYEHEGLYEGKRRVTIDRLGAGFRRIFTILLYIYHPQYTVVMIDEPETHLHPAMIKKLLWAMQNANAGQILSITHSPLFITPITLPQVVRVSKNQENHTQAFAINQAKYNYQRLIQELNADNLEMFFSDKVVLVEGVSDKLLLRGMIDKFYEGSKDIKVIQTHGKGNMRLYIDLLNIFKIPFLVVLDKDVMKTFHLRDLMRHLNINLAPLHDQDLICELKKYDIFVLPNGDLERNYPRKYQKEDSKSLNALRAANLMTPEDYHSKIMHNLREIVENL